MSALDNLCVAHLAVNFSDLPDVPYREAYESGMNGEEAFYHFLHEYWQDYAPLDSTYTQEFDEFTDADPGL